MREKLIKRHKKEKNKKKEDKRRKRRKIQKEEEVVERKGRGKSHVQQLMWQNLEDYAHKKLDTTQIHEKSEKYSQTFMTRFIKSRKNGSNQHLAILEHKEIWRDQTRRNWVRMITLDYSVNNMTPPKVGTPGKYIRATWQGQRIKERMAKLENVVKLEDVTTSET